MAVGMSACAWVSTQGVYEGVRQQQQIRREPSPPDTERLPDYEKFKKERDAMSPNDR